jgi:hypothetical protein
MDRVLDVKDVVPILGRDVLVVISKVVDVEDVVLTPGKNADVEKRVFRHPVLIASL